MQIDEQSIQSPPLASTSTPVYVQHTHMHTHVHIHTHNYTHRKRSYAYKRKSAFVIKKICVKQCKLETLDNVNTNLQHFVSAKCILARQEKMSRQFRFLLVEVVYLYLKCLGKEVSWISDSNWYIHHEILPNYRMGHNYKHKTYLSQMPYYLQLYTF